MADKKKPELIEDKDLEEASGGLPAVQKVREAAARTSSSSDAASPTATSTDIATGG